MAWVIPSSGSFLSWQVRLSRPLRGLPPALAHMCQWTAALPGDAPGTGFVGSSACPTTNLVLCMHQWVQRPGSEKLVAAALRMSKTFNGLYPGTRTLAFALPS